MSGEGEEGGEGGGFVEVWVFISPRSLGGVFAQEGAVVVANMCCLKPPPPQPLAQRRNCEPQRSIRISCPRPFHSTN